MLYKAFNKSLDNKDYKGTKLILCHYIKQDKYHKDVTF